MLTIIIILLAATSVNYVKRGLRDNATDLTSVVENHNYACKRHHDRTTDLNNMQNVSLYMVIRIPILTHFIPGWLENDILANQIIKHIVAFMITHKLKQLLCWMATHMRYSKPWANGRLSILLYFKSKPGRKKWSTSKCI